MQPSHVTITTPNPAHVTLRQMGKTAVEASDTMAVREWAARLATEAPPRDYEAMLRRLYDEILERWRYVPETEEWIHGNAKSLLGIVMGVKYNAPGVDPRGISMRGVPTDHKGWGDCDDISTVVAAAVRAIGMTPYFRVARSGGAGAHVSVMARTPEGRLISVDPVGHPKHPFGWALPAESIEMFSLEGTPASGFGAVDTMRQQHRGTMFTDPVGRRMRTMARRAHYVATHAADGRGPRALALPMREFKLFSKGYTLDGCPAYDENRQRYTYDADRDLWLSDQLLNTSVAGKDESLGGIGRRARRTRRAARRTKRKARRAPKRAQRQTRRARRRRIVSRVAQRVRPLAAKLMNSKLARTVVSNALMATGTPPHLTRAVMAAGGSILAQGGLPALVRTLRKDPRKAAQLVAQAAKSAGLKAASPFGADCGCGPVSYMVRQNGSAPFRAAPVMAMSGVPGFYSMGQLEVAAEPTPGQYYRIKRGDSLLKVAENAWGDRKSRFKHSKWINAAAANSVFHRPTKSGFEANSYGEGIISFSPDYSDDPESAKDGVGGSSYALIWIPEVQGDEPPEPVPDVADDGGEDIEPPVEPEVVVPPVVEDLPPVYPSVDVSSSPTPGSYYRIKRGDNLLTVAQKAWGDRKTRLMHSKWINAANANATFYRPSKPGFETSQYGRSVISFLPNYAEDDDAAAQGIGGSSYAVLWIPEAAGDEPGAIEPVVPEVEVIPEVEEVVPEVEVIPEVEEVVPEVEVIPEVEEVVPEVEADPREDCMDAGGTWVSGQGCVQCPEGQQWDWGANACRPTMPEVEPEVEVVPEVEIIPEVEPLLPDTVEPPVDDIGPPPVEDVVPDIGPVIPEVEPLLPDPVMPEAVEPWNPGGQPSGIDLSGHAIPIALAVIGWLSKEL